MNDAKIWPVVLDSIKKDVPNFEVSAKEDSMLFKVITPPLSLLNPNFKNFSTTIGFHTYMPAAKLGKAWGNLGHEGIHGRQYKKWGLLYNLSYWPEFLGPLALFALLAPFSHWFLLALVFVLAFVPWPNPFRVHWERMAFLMTACADACSGTNILADDYVTWMTNHYTTGQYYWMSWGKAKMRAQVIADMMLAQRIVAGTETLEPYSSTIALARAEDKAA